MIISRYPKSKNISLRPWSAVDEYILSYIKRTPDNWEGVHIYHDRFGYLACHLHNLRPVSVVQWKSQEKALTLNHSQNDLETFLCRELFMTGSNISRAIVKVPKSMDMFRLYLSEISHLMSSDGEVVCGFMTKYFTKQMINISEEYFDSVSQSLALKKSRLIHLKGPKKQVVTSHKLKNISWDSKRYGKIISLQYLGVFSANHIDYATQFLLESLPVYAGVEKILDLACGNGIIANALRIEYPDTTIHMMDDSFLALVSAKKNLGESEKRIYHYENVLDDLDENDFDLIVTNPPFHFGHENTIEISLQLFEGASKKLKDGGVFVVVANKHLNYITHLRRWFSTVEVMRENHAFVIYECQKGLSPDVVS